MKSVFEQDLNNKIMQNTITSTFIWHIMPSQCFPGFFPASISPIQVHCSKTHISEVFNQQKKIGQPPPKLSTRTMFLFGFPDLSLKQLRLDWKAPKPQVRGPVSDQIDGRPRSFFGRKKKTHIDRSPKGWRCSTNHWIQHLAIFVWTCHVVARKFFAWSGVPT